MYARDWLETHIKKSQVSYTDRVHQILEERNELIYTYINDIF